MSRTLKRNVVRETFQWFKDKIIQTDILGKIEFTNISTNIYGRMIHFLEFPRHNVSTILERFWQSLSI